MSGKNNADKKNILFIKNISEANIIKSLSQNEISRYQYAPGLMITVRGMTMIGFAAKPIIEEMRCENKQNCWN